MNNEVRQHKTRQEAQLLSQEELAPGVTVDEVLAKTGAELIIPEAAGRETQ